MTNNPPYVSLELTQEQAEFLLKNCNSNLTLGLQLVMACKSREQAEKFIQFNENFKAIRTMLLKQGVKET